MPDVFCSCFLKEKAHKNAALYESGVIFFLCHIQVFQNFIQNALEYFHIRVRNTGVEALIESDRFSVADGLDFSGPVGQKQAIFSCVFGKTFFPD